MRMCVRLIYQQLNSTSNLKHLLPGRPYASQITSAKNATEALAMSTCGRILLGNLKTLAILTLSVVTGLSSSVRAGAQTTQSPSSYNFGNVAINQTSVPEKITIKNTGASTITINSYAVSGGP